MHGVLLLVGYSLSFLRRYFKTSNFKYQRLRRPTVKKLPGNIVVQIIYVIIKLSILDLR